MESVAVNGRRHAIRFEPERGLEQIARDRLVVERAVFARLCRSDSKLPPPARIDRHELPRRNVRRALEHHVLAQMREPRVTRLFVLRAEVIPHANADDRRRVVFVEDRDQSIRQLDARERKRSNRDWLLRRADAKREHRGEHDIFALRRAASRNVCIRCCWRTGGQAGA